MSIVITGANGFIGKNLKNFLKKKNIEFKLIDKKFGDLSKKKNWKKVPNSNILIHLASPTIVDKSINKPEKYIENVLKINSNAIDYCIKNKAKLIFLSSVVYGSQKKKTLTEKLIPNPNNPYLKAKYLSEKKIEKKNNGNNFSYVILRVFNVYGRYQKKSFLIPHLISGLKKNIKIKNKYSSRDFVYIDDVIRAIFNATKCTKNTILNIASGKSYNVIELIKIINILVKKDIKFTSKEIYNKYEALFVKASIVKAKKYLNWRPTTNIVNGLKKTIKFYD